MGFIDIGFGNTVNSEKIVAIIGVDSAPVKRMIQLAREENMTIDATCGKKTASVIITDSQHIILSALTPEDIPENNQTKEFIDE